MRIPAPPKRGKQATSFQRQYILGLIEQRAEFSSTQLRQNLRVLLYRVCPAPAMSFGIGDDIESALYMLDIAEASRLIQILEGK